MKTKLLLVAFILCAGILSFTGCNKQEPVQGCMDATALNYNPSAVEDNGSCTYPFQGPLDPSFEAWANIPADVWKVDWLGGVNYSGFAQTGTGFLPSQGNQYMELPGNPFNTTDVNRIWQDNVDFSHSTTMKFDYSVTGSTLTTDTGKVEILFTSNGTVTLWSKTYTPSNPATTQQLNETITLPSLPDAGRLTIRTTYSPPGVSQRMVFDIDNIRTQ